MAAPPRFARIMACQHKAAVAADHPNLLVHMDEADMGIWTFLVTNLPGPYAGGEYLFRLTASPTFPQTPPVFEFLTPNGVFELGGSICISIGEFHARDAAGKAGSYGWRSVLGMIGFAREVVNGMVCPEHLGTGVRVANPPPSTKARLAAASEAFNAGHHAALMGAFRAFEVAHPGHAAVRLRAMWRAAAVAASMDFEAAEDPGAALAAAFGPEGWTLLAESLGRACAPGPAAPPGGRAVVRRVAPRVREALAERDPAVRHTLALALNARVLWELGVGDGADKRAWRPRFRAAFDAFAAALPSACGGACATCVPAAMAAVGRAPAAFPGVHAELVLFLRAQDIDGKARAGKVFATRASAAAQAAAARAAAALARPAPPALPAPPAPPRRPRRPPAGRAGRPGTLHGRLPRRAPRRVTGGRVFCLRPWPTPKKSVLGGVARGLRE